VAFVLLALALAVGVLALIPSLPPSIGTGWDKLNHIIAFAALAVAACRGFSGSPGRTSGALLAVLAFGVAIEVLQLLVGGRTASRGDLLADALGTGSGSIGRPRPLARYATHVLQGRAFAVGQPKGSARRRYATCALAVPHLFRTGLSTIRGQSWWCLTQIQPRDSRLARLESVYADEPQSETAFA
jgi:VanZ family protein